MSIFSRNVGGIDRLIRVGVAVGLGVLIFSGVVSDLWALVLATAGAVLVVTAFAGACPLYGLLGLRTDGGRSRERPRTL